jgi:hypothetical protein
MRTSITPKRLAFGGVGKKGQLQKGAIKHITPRRLAKKAEGNAQGQDGGASEEAAAAVDHWRVQDDSSSSGSEEPEEATPNEDAHTVGYARFSRRLREWLKTKKTTCQRVNLTNHRRTWRIFPAGRVA